MNKLIALAFLGISVAISAPAIAGPQQEKMKGCNVEAKGMKGEERRAFMSKCLKKDYVLKSDAGAKSAAPAKQQDKMKTCNADAKTKGLKGEERKAFMKDCLKK